MKNLFDKNLFRDTNEQIKVIIDTDPGVDDAACLIYAFQDKNVKIELLTTVVGNISIDIATRNTLHLLDLFDMDIPVAKGATTAMQRISPTAEFIHQKEGLGGYIPPKQSNRKLLDEDAVDAMYRVIMNGNGDIIPMVLGPHTNIGHLFIKHPDVINKIPKIVFMGGSPFGNPDYPDHVSFNLSCDPEAFKIVLDSGIPLLMIPSDVGRRKAHLDEEFVYKLGEINSVGKLLRDMYIKYWEPGYSNKRVATNDTLALFALIYPKMFTFKKTTVTVSLNDTPGKTFVEFDGVGNVEFITEVNRDAFLKLLITDLEKMSNIKIKTVK